MSILSDVCALVSTLPVDELLLYKDDLCLLPAAVQTTILDECITHETIPTLVRMFDHPEYDVEHVTRRRWYQTKFPEGPLVIVASLPCDYPFRLLGSRGEIYLVGDSGICVYCTRTGRLLHQEHHYYQMGPEPEQPVTVLSAACNTSSECDLIHVLTSEHMLFRYQWKYDQRKLQHVFSVVRIERILYVDSTIVRKWAVALKEKWSSVDSMIISELGSFGIEVSYPPHVLLPAVRMSDLLYFDHREKQCEFSHFTVDHVQGKWYAYVYIVRDPMYGGQGVVHCRDVIVQCLVEERGRLRIEDFLTNNHQVSLLHIVTAKGILILAMATGQFICWDIDAMYQHSMANEINQLPNSLLTDTGFAGIVDVQSSEDGTKLCVVSAQAFLQIYHWDNGEYHSLRVIDVYRAFMLNPMPAVRHQECMVLIDDTKLVYYDRSDPVRPKVLVWNFGPESAVATAPMIM